MDRQGHLPRERVPHGNCKTVPRDSPSRDSPAGRWKARAATYPVNEPSRISGFLSHVLHGGVMETTIKVEPEEEQDDMARGSMGNRFWFVPKDKAGIIRWGSSM